MGLGSLSVVSLAEARRKAAECRLLKYRGIDPIEARKAKHRESTNIRSFKECATAYVEARRSSWRNEKHGKQWTSSLESYVYPHFGNLRIQQIDSAHILKAVEPIWLSRNATAKRVLRRIEAIFNWASAMGFRTGENPAGPGRIEPALPSPPKHGRHKHHNALPYKDIPSFVTKLKDDDCVAARALELLILTAARTNEIAKAQWREIDLQNRIWIIPAERMKANREHRIPLSESAVSILRALPKTGSKHVFEGRRPESAMSNMAMLMLLRRMGRSDITVHGFRTSFRTWGSEETDHSDKCLELSLAHVNRDKVEAAYQRGDLLAKRRQLMEDWAAYCGIGAQRVAQ